MTEFQFCTQLDSGAMNKTKMKLRYESRKMVRGIRLKNRLKSSRNILQLKLNCDQLLDKHHIQK